MRYEWKLFWFCVANLLAVCLYLFLNGFVQAMEVLRPVADEVSRIEARWIMGTTGLQIMPFLTMLLVLLFVGGEMYIQARGRDITS